MYQANYTCGLLPMSILQTLPDLRNVYVPEGLTKLNAMQGVNEYTYCQVQESPAEI
jgi:hypothetical protein